MAAKDEGFEFIGIEKEKEYFDIAEARIKVTAPLEDFME
jgi:DNA modification methylase